MLVKFTVENLFSFNNEVTLNMIAGTARSKKDHYIAGTSRNDPKILKTAVIYGANASGKSNLIKAMAFAKTLIVKGTSNINELIPLKKFRLDKENLNKSVKVEFLIKIKKQFFSYGFLVHEDFIQEEWLYEIGKTSDSLLFKRMTQENKEVVVTPGKVDFKNPEDKKFFEFVGKGTRPNQLFLTESILRNMKVFFDIYRWFDKSLVIIFPATNFLSIEYRIMKDENFAENISRFLDHFDTGITKLITKELDFKKEIPGVPDDVKNNIYNTINNQSRVFLKDFTNNDRFTVYKNEFNDLKALKLHTVHETKTNEEILFELKDESDGTQRLLDLIPILINLTAESEKIFVIDELDRSLHSQLSYSILDYFLQHSTGFENQLIATTHELNLLDLNLLRRDEIWFIEKNKNGESQLYSLEEYKPRYDKDIRKNYLLGRFGAIPIVHKIKGLGWI